MASVDELFPEQTKSVDELFPVEVERDRYRRQTLGTSPIQDLIFGDTSVNPIARVLDHFGQGARQGWGTEPNGLSEESANALKKAGIFNDYDKGQRSVIKAMNETMFRGAATYLADPIMRGLPGLFRGTQEAVAQVGVEAGHPKLGREAAAAFEAFPAGLRQPTGVPHAPVKYAQSEMARSDGVPATDRVMAAAEAQSAKDAGGAETRILMAEIERARDLKTIGAGEEGWKGTVEPPKTEAPIARQEVPKETEAAPTPEVTPEPPPAASVAVDSAPINEAHPIAQDVTQRLVAAGRPVDEAAASAQVIASHYEARAARFGGELGTAEELYKREGAEIKPGKGVEPAPVEARPAPKPIEGGVAEVTPIETAQSRWDQFESERQGRLARYEVEVGYNPASSKSGAQLRSKSSQVWEPGNVVDVGFVKNLLIADKTEDGVFTLVSKPDKNGQSKSYEVKPHEGLGKGKPVDFMEATSGLSKERELAQTTRGKIRLREDAKPIITLFKDANESTFMHETGHQWLEELMGDAKHAKAPADLVADSKAVLDWFGVKAATEIKTRHHEQFARGFERYLMEGVAPSRELAGVFAKFKDWLTRIYETVARLKSPINDEIRGVFDRLIAQNPEKVRIEPEAPKNFADIHEADALHTAPEAAHPVAQTIRAERDRLAAEQIPEEHDARLEGVASGPGRREAGGPQPIRDGNEAARAAEAGNDQAAGEVGAGGSNAAAEGAGPSAQPRTEVPVNPNDTFKAETPLVDKAGNIRLDNLGTAEDVNQAIRDSATANNDFIDARRGVVTDGQVLELADALGMDAGQLNQRKLGQAFNAEQIMAARKLLIQSATTVRDAMIKAAEGKEADIMAYAEAKSRHRLIQEQVAGITAEAGRALRAFRKLEGQPEAAQLDAFLKDATGKTLFQLQREAQLGMQLETPAQVSKFVNDTAKPTWKEMVVEAWISALLSGPKTHVANIMGNTISGLWRPIETATSAAIGKARNLVTGSQDRVHFGEAAAELFGMVHGSKEGVVAAWKAFKTEEPQLTAARQVEQGHPKALPSATLNVLGKEIEIGGKQARIPLRLLGAEDEFFKAVAFRGDINRQAYAIAAKEGLPAEQFHARVAELSMTPTEEMITHAKAAAEYQTFQTPLGKVGRSVQNFANSHLLAKFVVPFVRTPLNLLKYAGERSPLGVFSQEVRDNLSGKNGGVARDTQIARITLGTMVGVAAYEMASQGLITGGGPADKGKKSIMQADGWQEYSVKIGDMYYRYSRLDPFSIILGIAADAYEINKAAGADHPEKEKLASLVFAAVTKNVLNRASLQGMSDVIQATSDPERYGKGYLKNMAGTLIPAISSQTAQTLDPVVRETRSVLDRLKSRIPGQSQDLMPKRDVWGEPVVREGGLGPDIASPIAESRLKNDPVNKALIGANYFPGKLDRKIRGVDLTDQQYDDYSRVAGRTAKMRLDMIVKMPGFEQMPEVTRKELMTNAVTSSREMARSLIMMQNPEIIKKANDAKLMKVRGEKAN